MANVALWVAVAKGVVDLVSFIRERRQARKPKPAKPCGPKARGLQ